MAFAQIALDACEGAVGVWMAVMADRFMRKRGTNVDRPLYQIKKAALGAVVIAVLVAGRIVAAGVLRAQP
ncbi:MAG: hypothetical protein ACYCYO_00120 [Bacilli bacterium]